MLPRPLCDDLTLRRASAADLDAIMRLEEAGFPPGIRERRAVFAERLRIFPAGFLLLCRADGEAVGYFCSERWPRREAIDPARLAMDHDIATTHRDDGEELYVSSMTVAPTRRGSGLGAAFFAAALDEVCALSGIASVFLMVNSEWHAARRIYAQMGFVECGRLAGFFHPAGATPQEAILMRAGSVALKESVYR